MHTDFHASVRQVYAHDFQALDFDFSCLLVRHVRLVSGFCSSDQRFAYSSFRFHLAMDTAHMKKGSGVFTGAF
jgi:hypothetical protein